MSQGWGHLGVGVLRDDGGDDGYRGEAGVQGAASMGIGVLVDGDGSDRYETYASSQGFSYVQGTGILFDAGDGDDVYWADHGAPALGGDPIYYTPQMPGEANGSFVQGAGLGMRGDGLSTPFLSGGVGILRDGGGDDVYTAGVFAQGTAYWQGLGILADAGGNDAYDAFWYVRGAAAHYSIAALLDGGGDDRYGMELGPIGGMLGSGHDFSIGAFIDESGDDAYRFSSLGAGASNCQGVGVFVDNDGADAYEALGTLSMGLGRQSGECADAGARSDVQSIGLFMDSGADTDSYLWPDANVPPDNDTSFGHVEIGHPSEKGGAVDGDGETGIHP
jgi:hypothetical protein